MPLAISKDSRREDFVQAAAALIADRGFHGTSIAAVADQLGVTKQALLHHFGSKERLYGEVLAGISDRMMAVLVEGQEERMSPEARLETFFAIYCEQALADSTDVRIIVRELMDNKQRAEQAGKWYLKPFLQELAAMVQDTGRWREASRNEAMLVAYQMLGAVSYFAISDPTLARMFGQDAHDDMARRFPDQVQYSLQRILGSI
ncbi:MAG: TetR family transcriptional regulator [Rhodobacteraceae bacterium]|nr:TetR family transcriptional regulator [Paracoccaceae bacterium]